MKKLYFAVFATIISLVAFSVPSMAQAICGTSAAAGMSMCTTSQGGNCCVPHSGIAHKSVNNGRPKIVKYSGKVPASSEQAEAPVNQGPAAYATGGNGGNGGNGNINNTTTVKNTAANSGTATASTVKGAQSSSFSPISAVSAAPVAATAAAAPAAAAASAAGSSASKSSGGASKGGSAKK